MKIYKVYFSNIEGHSLNEGGDKGRMRGDIVFDGVLPFKEQLDIMIGKYWFLVSNDYLKESEEKDKEIETLKHRLQTANEYIESRKENMIPEHYEDLKYIINECDLNSSW